jgi:hypothetical protein
MTLPARRGARSAHTAHPAHGILLALATLALVPAFVPWTTPSPTTDVTNLATKVSSRPKATAAVVPGGQFVRAMNRKGLPQFMFQDGLPEFWGSCGGTIAINSSSMSAGELSVVREAAADFAETASGPWVITSTTETRGSGSVVVLLVDTAVDHNGEWGLAHFSTAFGMGTAAPRFFMRISDVTVRLSGGMAGAQNAGLARSVTLHELGHLAGAGHNEVDPQALMAPKLDRAHLGYSSYTAAEAAGIRIGGSHGCS